VTIPASTVVRTVTAPAEESSTVPGWGWALLGALLMGLVFALYWLWKSRRPGDQPPPPAPPA
jgi:hypothetical protein